MATRSPPQFATTTDKEELFWEAKTLADLTDVEWESLCDGCGKCCLHKLEDEETGQLFHTNVACRLLDLHSGRCTRYTERLRWVPDCVQLTPAEVRQIRWLPATCAYRLRAESQPLPDWHPLRTGDPRSTQRAGMSIVGWAAPEGRVRRLEDHILESL
ncbi:MAG TPA: YcgN family cysteine cluster protein [Candidatus Competibacteraceae bacterium]|nr:YcgN family cysteine cluster protein [Candidatus Competibacteraceae bacterium]HPF57480.1 YcgN family cysteine cluster protein [Candidatus Competibacteraceae bacterium]HRY17186.1 YcgN family cysteine cluster protein [Candidatus Competibacteraceae bacterium]